MENMRHQVDASRVSGMEVFKRALWFCKGWEGRLGMPLETLSCLEGKKSLRVLSCLDGMKRTPWRNDKDFNFFFLHFKVKKNFSAMPFYTFIIRKRIQKKFLRIILLHLAWNFKSALVFLRKKNNLK